MSNFIDENNDTKTGAAKAKRCRDIYHLESSRIVCQLLIEQNDTWFITDIECKTEIMEESKWKFKIEMFLRIN